MCKHYARKAGGESKMADSQLIKIDRRAFNRGVDDLLTLRPLREIVEVVINSGKREPGGKRGVSPRWSSPSDTSRNVNERKSARSK